MTQFPENFNDEAVKKFLEEFYQISDTKPEVTEGPSSGENDLYATSFSEDGLLRLGPNPDKTGYAEIADFRQTAWKTLTSRKHIIGKVYVFSQNDVFLRGTVEYNFKDGSYKKVEWCGNMVFDKELREKGQVKIKFYHVFF